jgi:two-component system OmpR family response regulator
MISAARQIVTECDNGRVVANRLGSAYDLFIAVEGWLMANAPHILIVDDDRQIRASLARFLTASGFRISAAEDGAAMFAAIEKRRFDLVVLDIMMPGEDGLTLCRRLREASRIPVIFLTALSGEIDCVVGLELGADDYICKPIRPRELLARIRAVLRRVGDTASQREHQPVVAYEFEGWRLDAVRRTLRNPKGVLVELTGGEFDLLLVFAERPRHVLTRDQLLDLTRGKEAAVLDRSIDVQVGRLRRKIEADPQLPMLIKTVRSGGYVFCADVLVASAESVADAVS